MTYCTVCICIHAVIGDLVVFGLYGPSTCFRSYKAWSVIHIITIILRVCPIKACNLPKSQL